MTRPRTTPRPNVERPNTVSGLEAKKAELLRHRELLEAEIRKITCDIDHIEGAIKLFDPANTPAAIKRYVVRHRAKKGAVRQFVLRTLREAPAPVTSARMTELWLDARKLRTDDDTRTVIRKRLGACLIKLRAEGHVVNAERVGDLKAWKLG